jgi:hypothetical protein
MFLNRFENPTDPITIGETSSGEESIDIKVRRTPVDLTVVVLDHDSQAPVANAKVELDEPYMVETSDEHGEVVFKSLPTNTQTNITVEHIG